MEYERRTGNGGTAMDRVVPFMAGDGMPCNLIHVRSRRSTTKGPVMLVHGAGVRANIFRPPVRLSFVDYLLDHGYDVWLENWRASIDLPRNQWTLDQAALYDHPAAVRKVLEESNAATMKAIIHCQGSTSFIMSALAGLVPQVTTIVSNAVSLHPRVSWISHQKGRYAVPLVSQLTDYLNPQWGDRPDGLVPTALRGLVKLTHYECSNNVCRFSSFTYGTGFPVLWRHENLNDATHEWIRQEFANVPMSFFRQMTRCVNAGHLLAQEGLPGLPADFTAKPPETAARIAFVTGQMNNCFAWQSQQASFDWFDRHQPDFHSLRILGGYGHLDVFLGKNAANDTFPILLDELDRPNS